MALRIAFGYKMGTGKDTACSYLITKFGGHTLRFSEPLYKIMSYAQDICNLEKRKDRKFLQLVGTEWGRSTDPDIWLNLLLDKASHCCYKKQNLYLSDLRFPNELYRLKKEGWICVRIDRNVTSISTDRSGTGSVSHSSESSLDQVPDKDWDFILQNNDSFDDFYSSLYKLYDDLMKSKVDSLTPSKSTLKLECTENHTDLLLEKDWIEGET